MRKYKWDKRELVNAVLYLVIYLMISRQFLPCIAFIVEPVFPVFGIEEHLVRVTRQRTGVKSRFWVAGLATFAYPTLKKICGDGGYRGSFVYEAHKYFGLQVEISKKLKPHGWQVLPKRL